MNQSIAQHEAPAIARAREMELKNRREEIAWHLRRSIGERCLSWSMRMMDLAAWLLKSEQVARFAKLDRHLVKNYL